MEEIKEPLYWRFMMAVGPLWAFIICASAAATLYLTVTSGLDKVLMAVGK
jgi:hypothetical protein